MSQPDSIVMTIAQATYLQGSPVLVLNAWLVVDTPAELSIAPQTCARSKQADRKTVCAERSPVARGVCGAGVCFLPAAHDDASAA